MAVEKRIPAAAILQNYLIGRFMFRLAKSEYKDKFIIKGGILISSIIGIEQRSTMDLDVTIRHMQLDEKALTNAFSYICAIPGDDGIEFVFNNIVPIRDDDEYGGYRITFTAAFGKIHAPMSMDITAGDVITPNAKIHEFADLFEPEKKTPLLAYPLETVLAEKLETILSRGVENTRPRDFYDVYMLATTECDSQTLKDAFVATAKHRGSWNKITDYNGIIEAIRNDLTMNDRWRRYQKQTSYVENVPFHDALDVIVQLLSEV